jgi:arsenate reductase-like glutaredoxin family protein
MADPVRVLFNPSCSKCRSAKELLDARGERVVRGERAVIARPPEKLLELFDDR